MHRYTVIDLGSNTIRLVAYDVRTDRRSFRKYGKTDRSKLFNSAVNEKKTVGLSTYVSDGVLSQEGIDKAVDVLSDLLEIAKNIDSDKTNIFATAVLRNCSNSKEAIHEIEDRIDSKIHLLSETDEAHLGYIGATCTDPGAIGTLIDIGGGSTELTSLTEDGDKNSVSIGMGSVSSYAKHVKLILPTIEEIESIAGDFVERLNSLENLKPYKCDVLYGIGGSVRAIVKLDALIFDRGKKLKDISLQHINDVIAFLHEDPSKFAHLAVRAVPDRLHSLVPGAVILRTCMEAFGAQNASIRKYGVREGYLLERMLRV